MRESLSMGNLPAGRPKALDAGSSGSKLAAELLARFLEAGFTSLYVVPPILRGGGRDYAAAAAALVAPTA